MYESLIVISRPPDSINSLQNGCSRRTQPQVRCHRWWRCACSLRVRAEEQLRYPSYCKFPSRATLRYKLLQRFTHWPFAEHYLFLYCCSFPRSRSRCQISYHHSNVSRWRCIFCRKGTIPQHVSWEIESKNHDRVLQTKTRRLQLLVQSQVHTTFVLLHQHMVFQLSSIPITAPRSCFHGWTGSWTQMRPTLSCMASLFSHPTWLICQKRRWTSILRPLPNTSNALPQWSSGLRW